ncbi:MAG TPA: M23 family metallopeptidase [Nitrospirae bacterium]|nr:M23 family metallopeptidase [Nitrospirota bacterium]HDO25360.1 M23 family metallopeptidase [Nitrospirota bacterium]
MNRYGYRRKSTFSIKNVGLLLVVIFIVFGAGYGVYKLFFIPAPIIEGKEAFNSLPLDKTITLKGKNLRSIDITIIQGEKKIELLKDIPETGEKTYTLQVKPKDMGLTDGPATVVIRARSGILKDIKYEVSSTIDTIPPKLEVLKASPYIDRGSAGFASFRASDADSVFVKLDEHMFRAFRSGPETESIYYVFFPAPLDIKDKAVFYVVAKDTAGNQTVRSLPTKFKDKKYTESSITIDDSFMNSVISPLLNETSISDPVSSFKKVNEDWRKESMTKVFELGQTTDPDILWDGRFLQLRNSKVMAKYGDRRVYLYNGKAISRSVHLGYDLASVSNSPVEAANSGVVRFSGDLGIYGNTVIIDHGMGLMSLYGHLSTVTVRQGQSVEKGDIIAQTGSTGLAGGDHLHFGILLHGIEISPLYWWDPHWIKVNILDYLEQ